MPTHYNRNKGRKKSGLNWDWERAAQGAISGAAAGSSGGPYGIAGGALIGGAAGGLTGRDEGADYTAFDEALDHYAGRSRKDARMLSDELSADLGANLASRGINNSRLGAGIVNANRGRVMGAAQGNIDKMRADMHARIAEAEYNADMAHDANTRQGWLNLARQLGMQAMMGDFGGGGDDEETEALNKRFDRLVDSSDQSAIEANQLLREQDAIREGKVPLAVTPGEPPQPPITGDRDRGLYPSPIEGGGGAPGGGTSDGWLLGKYNPIEDLFGGEDNRSTPTGAPDGGESDDWLLGEYNPIEDLENQSKERLRSALLPEEMQVLEEVFPDGELDRILDPSERSTLPDWAPTYEAPPPSEPNQRREQFGPNPGDSDYPEYMRRLYPTPEDARQDGISEEDIRIIYGASSAPPVMDVPPPSERSTLPDWAEDDGVINITPLDVDSEWATEEKMNGLPEYMGYIYDDEAGYNASDPSYAGIKQGTYTEWRERNRMYGAPKDVKDLAKNPEAIALFYQDYIQAAGVPHRFARTLALEYMYVDFAIHGGHAGARQILNDARQMLRAKGSTHPTDTELLTAFNRAKKDFYERQGANAGAFLGRADRVYDRSMKMMGGIS